jgi:hypothetical protein
MLVRQHALQTSGWPDADAIQLKTHNFELNTHSAFSIQHSTFNTACYNMRRTVAWMVVRSQGSIEALMHSVARLMFILLLGLLAGCAQIGRAPTATPLTPQRIVIIAPRAGATVSSPLLVRGSVAAPPANGSLQYRVFDQRGTLVGSGLLSVTAAGAGAGQFEGQVVYAAAENGPGKLELRDLNSSSGAINAGAEIALNLTTPGGVIVVPTPPGLLTVVPGAATPLPIYPGPPTPLPGMATQLPGMATPLPAVFTPTAIVVPPAATGTAIVVAPAATPGPAVDTQQIMFDSPAPGTLVGSPVLIAGHTTRFPFQANLSYIIRDAAGQVVGQGLIGVDGQEGQPGSFRVELDFAPPSQQGALTIELADEDAASGLVAARATLQLSFGTLVSVAPTAPPTVVASAVAAVQSITIDSPPANTAVGSPIVVTGHVAVPPATGRLYYRVTDAAAALLGQGTFTIGSDPSRPLAFNTTIAFTLPQREGPIAVEITDRDANGNPVGRATLVAQVRLPGAYPQP